MGLENAEVLLNDGVSMVLLNDGVSFLQLNQLDIGIEIRNVHAVADLRGITLKKKRRRTQTVMEALGQISRVIPLIGSARLFRKNQLSATSKITKTIEFRMVGKLWRHNKLWMESTLFSSKGIKVPISDIEKEMREKMKKGKLRKMMKEFRREFG